MKKSRTVKKKIHGEGKGLKKHDQNITLLTIVVCYRKQAKLI